MTSKLDQARCPSAGSSASDEAQPPRTGPKSRLLDPDRLPDHIDHLYRAAWALCGSKHEAEDLVQETFVSVFKRPRRRRHGNELGYLLRALRNTYINRLRSASRQPATQQLFEDDTQRHNESHLTAREIMEAIATASPAYRDAVIAVDVLGLSYREAARALRTRGATITTRLHRGRQHVARQLLDGPRSAG